MKLAMLENEPVVITGTPEDLSAAPIQNADLVMAAWALGAERLSLGKAQTIQPDQLICPLPESRQVFAVGMNYAAHTKELHVAAPKAPSVFTKFPSSLTGPTVTVPHHGTKTDWETELVVVIGQGGRDISQGDALNHVAGYMVGQDLSDRAVQFINDPPQFSLAKSFAGYGPIGPWLTTPDEVPDLARQTLTTTVNGQAMQRSLLSDLIFSPADLVAYLSSIVELMPGDLIFTGTPSGTGVGRDPQIFLQAGDQLVSQITGLGTLHITIA